MKTKSEFLLRQVAGSWVILPIGDGSAKGVLTPNESGAMLWRILEQGCQIQELIDALTKEYDVSAAQAKADVQEFLEKLRTIGCLED